MSAPNAVWMVPVRFDATSYVVRVTINGVTSDLTFPATGSLTVGRDYWMSGDAQTSTESTGTGRADLVAMLQATLRTHSQGASATASLSSSTWLLTCASGGLATMRILWSHANTTLDATIFGYENAADSDLLASIVSPHAVLGPMLPGRAIAEDSKDYQPIVGGVSSALSGLTRTSRLTAGLRHREVVFRYLLESATLSPSEGADQDEWSTVEYAWTYAISKGWPVRAYDQASDVAGGSYRLYRTRSLDYPIDRDDAPAVWWRARFELVREVDSR